MGGIRKRLRCLIVGHDMTMTSTVEAARIDRDAASCRMVCERCHASWKYDVEAGRFLCAPPSEGS